MRNFQSQNYWIEVCIGMVLGIFWIRYYSAHPHIHVYKQKNLISELIPLWTKGFVSFIIPYGHLIICNRAHYTRTLLEQGCFTSHLLSFDNNKVLKIINWIC